VADTTRELLHLGDRRIEVIPNPIDLSLFEPKPDQAQHEEPGLVLFVGTVCAKKGVRELVLAMDRVVSRVPHARLVIVGRDSQEAGGSYVRYLRTLIPPHLRTRIVFKGPVERTELPAIIAGAQVCVYPSHMEALPVAWLEGMAMGKACVASELGPGPEVFEHGVSGLLCDPREPAAIATHLINLLRHRDLRQQLGAAARARAVEHFAEAALVRTNETFYERCAQESARARA
jgi:glycosyltransferase involved in cell wall biosynthesis